jgi:hypothetical protein
MADHMTAEQVREELADKAQLYRSQALAMESLADDEIAEILDGFADCLESIAAHLSGMAADTWQPIETAPRDGTEIVVCWPKVEIDDDCELTNKAIGYVRAISSFAGGAWVEPEFLEANGPSFDDDWDFAMSPSHWMPLPAAPEPPHV